MNYKDLNKQIDKDIKLIDNINEKQYNDNKKLNKEIIIKKK